MSEEVVKTTAATETTTQKAQPSEPISAQEPAFYKWQLKDSGLLNAQVDVIEALLEDNKQYTLAEATRMIDEFMKKEV